MHLRSLISQKFSILKQTQCSSHLNFNIRALVQKNQHFEALQCYSKESNFPLKAFNLTFTSLLKACASLQSLSIGKTIHATLMVMGLQCDPFIATSLINMYVKCGLICNAVKVFDEMSRWEALRYDATVWNAMIDGYSKNGMRKECEARFREMQGLQVKPDGYTMSIVLGVFSGILKGKEIHGYVIRNGFEGDSFVVMALVDMYSNCGRAMDAWRVFESQGDHNDNNVVIWNAMMSGFCKNGLWSRSLELYSLLREKNREIISSTCCSALTACCEGEDIEFGRQVHSDVVRMGFGSDQYVHTSLLTMYAKCGLIEDAEEVFGSVSKKGVETWNAMVSAYIGDGCVHESLLTYNQMKVEAVPSDSFTISNILTSCGTIGFHDFGRLLHAELVKRPVQSNVAVQGALMTMYSKCGKVEEALEVFGGMEEKDVAAWGAMISAFYQNKRFEEAVGLCKEMLSFTAKPDANILAVAMNTSVWLESVELGCSFFGLTIKLGLESDAFVGSSLMDFYSKLGQPEMAKNIFYGISNKNLVVWNSLISCYSQNGLLELSIRVLPQIIQHGLIPDAVSVTSTLVAVSSAAALIKGKAIHSYLIRHQIPQDNQVENALIDMYIKSGFLKYAERAFDNMSRRTLVTWNSMISGYGSHGECLKAIDLFREMTTSGTAPDNVTFLSLISACNHSGLVDEGLKLFQSMQDHNLEPQMDHYVNIVDLLGRTGRLDDAYAFILNMPIESDPSIWLCLLSACRVHNNVELGELAAQKLLKIESARSSNYVQVMNLYGEAGMKEKAANLRAQMKQKGLKKIGGCSWIESKDSTDVFFSGDSSFPRTTEVYATLHCLRSTMKWKGDDYHEVADTIWY